MADLSLFYSDIRNILDSARQKAYSAVNFAMIEAYWHIGQRIIQEEQQGKSRADYGEYLIKELSKALTSELGKGFSYANLWNFRQFYLTFPEQEKLYALRRELTWTHYRLIMRIENPRARDYYIQESAEQRWSTRQLERNINSHYFERLISSNDMMTALGAQKNFEKILPHDFIKDPYVLEFLQLNEEPWPLEKDIEMAIIGKLQSFLLEIGKGFSFIGRQFRVSTETKHCLVVKLIPLSDLRKIIKKINDEIDGLNIICKRKISLIISLFESCAEKNIIELK